MDLLNLNICPCCSPSLIVILGTMLWLFVILCTFVLQIFTKKGSTIQRFLINMCQALVLLVVILFGCLSLFPDLRSFVFSKVLLSTKSADMDPLRCSLLGGIKGRILELGPGGGANFKCWNPDGGFDSKITEWVGVEPNTFFKTALEAEQTNQNITFPTSIVWMNGENNLDIEPNSFDAVVATHVLCSVDDIDAVLAQVSRALKPGGTYHFMEHVATQEKYTTMWALQMLMDPFLALVGNGCGIRNIWEPLNALGLEGTFDVQLEHFMAPMPIPPLVPHIQGTVTKR